MFLESVHWMLFLSVPFVFYLYKRLAVALCCFNLLVTLLRQRLVVLFILSQKIYRLGYHYHFKPGFRAIIRTRPDKLPSQSRAGGQGLSLRSPEYLGSCSEAKGRKKHKKKVKCDGRTDGPTDRRTKTKDQVEIDSLVVT